MYLIDNFFGNLLLEALIGVYLINHMNNVRLDTDDNIFKQWSERLKDGKAEDGTYSYCVCYNIFKKTGFYQEEPKPLRDTFVNFIDDTKVFYQTFVFGDAIVLITLTIFKIADVTHTFRNLFFLRF